MHILVRVRARARARARASALVPLAHLPRVRARDRVMG
jgi:hypothetical protein